MGDQDAAAARGRRHAESEAILTGDEEVRLADQAADSDAEPDTSDAPAENAGQADLAPDSASETAGLADLPRLTPAHSPVRPAPAAALAVAAGLAFALLTVWVAGRGTAVPALDEELHRWALAHRGPGTIAVARAARWGGTTYVVL
ncbi:MAG TPA: hypothetical protein VK586_06675, partial [Streptosporangiaceae bacterium]|nr:hypothetical protein [Streptosporangiaceae bacterium]